MNVARLAVILCHVLVAPLVAHSAAAEGAVAPVGVFEGHQDVGTVVGKGGVEFEAAAGRYAVAGGGENMWRDQDAFHFAWKKMSGDLTLTADVSFVGTGGDPHRKACLMVRQSLEADSAYVDVALHGDGLTSLQFRKPKGAMTHEVQANVKAPRRLRLEKHGTYARMYLAAEGGEPAFSGTATRITFEEPFYVGIGVCAHNRDAVEKAVFSNVEVKAAAPPAAARRPVLYSTLETQVIASTDRRVTLVTPSRIEAPNWQRDGQTLIYNGGGRIYRVPVVGGTPEVLDTGFATRCNNDHGVTPDGTTLAISDQSQTVDGQRPSLIYTLPIAGGTPTRVTPAGPSYLSRVVARRQNACLLRPAQRRVRHLHHPRRRRRGETPDPRQGPRRRPGVFPRRPIHLLQLRPHRHDADLAHEGRRLGPGAGDGRRIQ